MRIRQGPRGRGVKEQVKRSEFEKRKIPSNHHKFEHMPLNICHAGLAGILLQNKERFPTIGNNRTIELRQRPQNIIIKKITPLFQQGDFR